MFQRLEGTQRTFLLPENGKQDVVMVMLRECTNFRQNRLQSLGMLLLLGDGSMHYTAPSIPAERMKCREMSLQL